MEKLEIEEENTIFVDEPSQLKKKELEKGCNIQKENVPSSPSFNVLTTAENTSTDVAKVPGTPESNMATKHQNNCLITLGLDSRRDEEAGKEKDETMECCGKLNVKETIPLQVSCGTENISKTSDIVLDHHEDCELEENEESMDLTSTCLSLKTVKFFNEKYSIVKTPLKLSVDQNGNQLKFSANALIEQSSSINQNSRATLNSTSVEVSKENKKVENSQIDNSRPSSEVDTTNIANDISIHTENSKDHIYSNIDNNLKDITISAPISIQSDPSKASPHSGFSNTVNVKPMFLGSLMSNDGSVYYVPLANPGITSGLGISVIQPSSHLYSSMMAPNGSDPNFLASIPVNSNIFQVLSSGCHLSMPLTTSSIISLQSLQQTLSYMMAPLDNNPNSTVSIPVNQPNDLPSSSNTNLPASFDSREKTCSLTAMASSTNIPDSIPSIPEGTKRFHIPLSPGSSQLSPPDTTGSISPTGQKSFYFNEDNDPSEPRCDNVIYEEKKSDIPRQEPTLHQDIPPSHRNSSQHQHSKYKTSTLIRVSPRYSETRGSYSPLVKVSNNVSPLKPIRGHIQQYVITHGHDKRLVTGRTEDEGTGDRCKIRKPIYLKGTPPQGYKRRLLTTTVKTANEEKKRRFKLKSYHSKIEIEDTVPQQTTNLASDVRRESSAGMLEFQDKTSKESCASINQDIQKPKTPSKICCDPETLICAQTPKESCILDGQDTQRFTTFICTASGVKAAGRTQVLKESYMSNDQVTEQPKTPNKSCKPFEPMTPKETCLPSDQSTQIRTQVLSGNSVKMTPSDVELKTPRNGLMTPSNGLRTPSNGLMTPGEFRTPDAKVFKKTPKNEDKERKREREHRNCLEIQKGFRYLSGLLPGTHQSWSRLKILNRAIKYVKEMQDKLKDYEIASEEKIGEETSSVVEMDNNPQSGTSEGLTIASIEETVHTDSPDHVVPRALDSSLLTPIQNDHTSNEHSGFTDINEISEVEDPTSNVYVVENVEENMHLVENPIYILYSPDNNNNNADGINTSGETRSNAQDMLGCYTTMVDSGNPNSVREQEIAVKSIERYRFNENQTQIVPEGRDTLEGRDALEGWNTLDGSHVVERREAPEGRAASDGQGKDVGRDGPEGQSQLDQPPVEIEVVSEGSVYGYNEEPTYYTDRGGSSLDWNLSPRIQGQYFLGNVSSPMGSPGELQGHVGRRVLYTTGPSLAELLSSPVILVPEGHSISEPGEDTHDQEPPCSPQYGSYRNSNATKDMSPFVVPHSPEGLFLGGTQSQLQIEDFSQSSNSQESENTVYGAVSEDVLNYVGVAVSPFATPRLGFLPSFADLSPSQVIPDNSYTHEETGEYPVGGAPNIVLSEVTDFSEIGLISVAASVEISAENKPEKKNPRKKTRKSTSTSQRCTKRSSVKGSPSGTQATNQTKKPKKKTKKENELSKQEESRAHDGTNYLNLSPEQTRSILTEYNGLNTPSPRIRGRKIKQTPNQETLSAVIAPPCSVPKKRKRKTSKSQYAECKRQLIDDQSNTGASNTDDSPINSRVVSDVPVKRSRNQKLDRTRAP